MEIRTDDGNSASWKVAERAGFTLEALLRGDSLTPAGEVRSTRVYARVRGIEEPLALRAASGTMAQSSTEAPGENWSTASVMRPSMPSAQQALRLGRRR